MTWVVAPTQDAWCKALGIRRGEFEASVVSYGKKFLPGLPGTWIEPYLLACMQVVQAAQVFFGDHEKALLWLRGGPLAPFGGATPRALLAQGRFDDVRYALRVGEIGLQEFWQEHQAGARFRTLVFLDLDGVVCLRGIEPLNELKRDLLAGTPLEPALNRYRRAWRTLFEARAVRYLMRIHAEFHPLYVLTSSWRLHFDEQTLIALLERSKLRFVGEGLHDDFRTGVGRVPNRWRELQDWVAEHPEMAKNYVVLDDTCSGGDIHRALAVLPANLQHRFAPFIVLCNASQGITDIEFGALHQALTLREAELDRDSYPTDL